MRVARASQRGALVKIRSSGVERREEKRARQEKNRDAARERSGEKSHAIEIYL